MELRRAPGRDGSATSLHTGCAHLVLHADGLHGVDGAQAAALVDVQVLERGAVEERQPGPVLPAADPRAVVAAQDRPASAPRKGTGARRSRAVSRVLRRLGQPRGNLRREAESAPGCRGGPAQACGSWIACAAARPALTGRAPRSSRPARARARGTRARGRPARSTRSWAPWSWRSPSAWTACPAHTKHAFVSVSAPLPAQGPPTRPPISQPAPWQVCRPPEETAERGPGEAQALPQALTCRSVATSSSRERGAAPLDASDGKALAPGPPPVPSELGTLGRSPECSEGCCACRKGRSR